MSSLDLLNYSEAELVLGLVTPVGTDTDKITDALRDSLRTFGYHSVELRLSRFLQDIEHGITINTENEAAKINSQMDAGNAVRKQIGRGDALVLHAIGEIVTRRQRDDADNNKPQPKTAYILRSLKHPDEVNTLRRVYGEGFFLIGIYSPEEKRFENLVRNKGISEDEAKKLILRDQNEEISTNIGQKTRETFQLSDAFVSLTNVAEARSQINRVVDLVFGDPFVTPTKNEYAMFQAFTASLRSADLSRQVGAVILSGEGELIAVGANDVPKAGGGLYWCDADDQRDYVWQIDSNAKKRDEILKSIVKVVQNLTPSEEKVNDDDVLQKVKDGLSNSVLLDITEFGRPVHAEMEAVLSCARIGISPRGGTLYSTTFPCHNCAKHIVAAGIKQVIYVEPYPKSKAKELHGDSIDIDGKCQGSSKVIFEPFVGIGPRRFIDLFSMILGSGHPLKRKKKGSPEKLEWKRENAQPRVPMLPTSYLQRESLVLANYEKLKPKYNGEENGGIEKQD